MQKKQCTSRQLQAIKTKNKIYDAALELISKEGFDNVTVESISKSAGVSVGAFYHHFASKDDVFYATYKELDDYLNKEETLKRLKSDKQFDNIVEFFKIYAEFQVYRGLTAVRHLFSAQNKLFSDRHRTLFVMLEKFVKEGKELGEFSSEYPDQVIIEYFMVIARGTVYNWCVDSGEYDLPERMVQNFEMTRNVFIK